LKRLLVGICGSIDSKTEARYRPDLTLKQEGMQRLIMELAPDPLPLRQVQARHPDLSEAVDQLLELQVLRLEAGKVHLNFTLITNEDRRTLFRVCDPAASSLGEAMAQREEEIHGMLAQYRHPCVSPGMLAFVLVGCCVLDWRGLKLLPPAGYMDSAPKMPGGNQYTLFAEELDPQLRLKGMYWGSHSRKAGRYSFITFGDHDPETVRRALPDALGRVQVEPASLHTMLEGATARIMEQLAGFLERIPPGGIPMDEAVRDEDDSPCHSALADLGYIRMDDDVLHLAVPFFTTEHTPIMEGVCAIVEPTMLDWLAASYQDLQQELAELTPLRHGVPFSRAMIQVWHYLFGLTNRYLTRQGLMMDPHGSESATKGYVPFVYPREWDGMLAWM